MSLISRGDRVPSFQAIGLRIRQHRESHGWSQQQLASKIPVSQKQLSRIEQAQIVHVDRPTIVRIASVLDVPIRTGEVNRWLFSLDYRPLVEPLLPLPPWYQSLVEQFSPYPAILADIGWYLRFWNPAMENFYKLPNGSLTGLNGNMFIQFFHPQGILRQSYTEQGRRQILSRLLWEWAPYENEQWILDIKGHIEQYLGISCEKSRAEYEAFDIPNTPAVSEHITLRIDGQDTPGRFRTVLVPVAHRPDLRIIVYEPINPGAEEWCLLNGHRYQG